MALLAPKMLFALLKGEPMRFRLILSLLIIALNIIAINASSMAQGLSTDKGSPEISQSSPKIEMDKQRSNIAVFPARAAVILNTGSTNRDGYEMVIMRSGLLFYTVSYQTGAFLTFYDDKPLTME